MLTSSPVPRSPSQRAKRAGFALLITITLLAFLVVLLVGLASYMRVETAVAGNTQRQTQARQNALMALDVALGQLQRYAGPDKRVTATADAFGGATGTKHFTGVWATDPADDPDGDPLTPLTWLVSGNEAQAGGVAAPLSVKPTTTLIAANSVELVGNRTVGTARDVVAPLQAVTTVGAPGVAGASAVTIGRYAWWIGDQGVKAPVAVPDTTAAIDYAPWDSVELRSRLRQQLGLGAGAANAAGAAVFEPHSAANSPLVANQKTSAYNQLAFLRSPAGTALGLTPLKTYFHAWSPNNFNVLANTKLGGLRQDLSLDATPLGPAFAAWADYKTYMEDPTAPVTPTPLPAYGPDPLRRRYRITPPVAAGNAGVAPVLTYFYILVGVQKTSGPAPYTIGLRWAAALWNPYSSAMVPEDLHLEISGLPNSIAIAARGAAAPAGSGTVDVTVPFRSLYGNPLKAQLPWDYTTNQTGDKESWLPGRTYNWVSTADASFASGSTNTGQFDSRSIPGLTNGLVVSVPGSAAVLGTSELSLSIPAQTTLTIKLVRDSDNALLATYTSPTYDAVPTTDEFTASGSTSPVGFLFRMSESYDTLGTDPSIWLTTEGRDPRSDQFPAAGLTTSPKSTDPTDCKNFTTISFPERFFDRDVTNGTSYNEDVPLAELPRSPIISLGELQHFFIADARPFAIGNSWGGQKLINGLKCNELFDEFYFSGLGPTTTPSTVNGALSLPNPLLKAMPRNGTTGVALTADDLRGAPNALSAKFLFQGGAFNLNSTSSLAWAAMLRAGRFAAPTTFNYLDSDPATGTADDATVATVQPTDAQFFRFAQSAQEDFKADDTYVQSTFSTTASTPIINTPLFRKGVRTIDATQVTALANAIAAEVVQKQADSGPFISVEDFLNPSPLFLDAKGQPVSLLEKAIETVGINATVAEFSSHWLTQGDIMTALAPVLFPRSDTFIIRTYGEAVNPTTGATEGKAWCEATVQRVPEYFDKTNAEEISPSDSALTDLNKNFGRRFKVVSFRWLTRSDI